MEGNRPISTYFVRVRPDAYRKLQNLAREDGVSVSAVIDRIVEETRRARILTEASEAYVAIAADPVADASWRAEIAAWDVTVGDGLPQEPEESDPA